MMLRFNINPALMRCRRGCFLNTSQVAQNVEYLVRAFSFNLTDISSRKLYAHHQPPAFYSWTGQRSQFLLIDDYEEEEEEEEEIYLTQTKIQLQLIT